MNEETIVAVFDSAEQADAAVRDLIADDVPESAISRHARSGGGMAPVDETTIPEPPREEGFWSRLFGGDHDYDHQVYDGHVYDRSVESGSTVISVRVSDAHVTRVSETREEAVVSKTAYVTEEVRLRREAVDRVETVRDTVRREEIEVEQTPEETVAAPLR
jgi:hypothetical protein